MCYEVILETFTAVGTVGAVVVGMIAINRSDKNSQQQILVNKLEELYTTIQSFSRYYGTFMELYFQLMAQRKGEKEELRTQSQYFALKNEKLSAEQQEDIISYCSRIEVLGKCYTDGVLKEKVLHFHDLMFSFSELILTGGSQHQELKWRNGFPEYEDFYQEVEDLKRMIVEKIDLSKRRRFRYYCN